MTVYVIGLFQGLSLVAFPAAATILTSKSGYDLSKSQYGLLFVPQVAMAIAGSLALPNLARRFPLKWVLLGGLISDTVSMSLLAGSVPLKARRHRLPGAPGRHRHPGPRLWSHPRVDQYLRGCLHARPPRCRLDRSQRIARAGDGAVPFSHLAVHQTGPVVVPASPRRRRAGRAHSSGLGPAYGLTSAAPSDRARPEQTREKSTAAGGGGARIPTLFWVFAGALVIYGIGETMFGNWGTTLLVSKGVVATSAQNALAVFWAAVTLGRLAIALVSNRVRSTNIYVVLPWAIAIALVLAPLAHSAAAGIAVFAFGGLACSGFFPMTIGYGESTFPSIIELAAGWLIAAYQVGYGLAAFGAGALQHFVSLPSLFRIAALAMVVMAMLAVVVARQQRPSSELSVSPATTS